jgi:dTDP-4-dehydrorhamnose 3,5-epimerase
MSRFSITDLPLADLKLIQRTQIGDDRGFLSRMFCATELAVAGWDRAIAQINHTHTAKRGTVRGMHFQLAPFAEKKLVSCVRGEVWDVAVDLRKGSSTFLTWHAQRLTANNCCALLIPEGFAHGFQALTDDVELIYCHSQAYAAHAESALNALDPRLAIAWPLTITERSSRDADHAMMNSNFEGVQI